MLIAKCQLFCFDVKVLIILYHQRWPWKSIILDAIITRNGHQRRNKGLEESLFLFPQTMYYTKIISGRNCRFIKLITSDCIFYILCDWFSSWRIHFMKQKNFIFIFLNSVCSWNQMLKSIRIRFFCIIRTTVVDFLATQKNNASFFIELSKKISQISTYHL